MKQTGNKRRAGSGRSLNLVLWFAFSVFALVIILIYAVLQNLLVRKQYREQAADLLVEAGARMTETVAENEDSSTLARSLYGVANSYGLSLYVLYETGESVYAEYTDKTYYPDVASVIENALLNQSSILFENETGLSYGTKVSIDNRTCYLYLATPYEFLNTNIGNFHWMSLMTGLFSVVLAFIVSGFLAVMITKPVVEVTERARQLARRDYRLNLKNDYFCSEISELSDALDYAGTEISKADKMQKELIANVSHDFKTPLTMIKAYASMIREISGEDKEKRDAHAQIIIDESDRLTALVSDLLDLSKLQAGVTGDDKTVFNLSDEVYRIAGRFDYLKETSGYSIDIEVEDELYARANRERIEQVLYNLIGNAMNYTGKDKRVRVKLFRKDSVARFEVIDTGKGIPPEELNDIWDRYYRSNKNKYKRPVQGTGLGLSIVKNILLAQEFPFGVVSEVGKGSCFWVEFSPPEDGEIPEKNTPKKKKSKRRAGC